MIKLWADILAKQKLYSQNGHQCSLAQALISDGTLANTLYRLQEFLGEHGLRPLALIPHWFNKWINGCVIGTRASFGPGLMLVHPIGVVINSSVKGGANIVIQSGVVLGENRGRSPVLDDGVFVGAGAKVIGGIHLGANATIGANAVVTKDVRAGAKMVGIPAREI